MHLNEMIYLFTNKNRYNIHIDKEGEFLWFGNILEKQIKNIMILK